MRQNGLELIRVTSPEHPMYGPALDLYRMSFPLHEQREPRSQARILSSEAYCFGLICEASRFVGLALFWDSGPFLYLEHLCIVPELRNRGYGERLLALLAERRKRIILEIDPPVDELSVRRKGFYERCGFTANPFRHRHHPYHRDDAGHVLVVMSAPEPLTAEEYAAFDRYLRDEVMRDAFE